MDESGFYRVELTGARVPVSFAAIHALRQDILLYFDDNLGEGINVLLPYEQLCQPYWQFLSIGFDQERAESAHYQKLVEEGCLALLNGLALDLLDQPPAPESPHWQSFDIELILRYIQQYQPASPRLATARQHLLRTYDFIRRFGPHDTNADGLLVGFDPAPAGAWFDREIVQAYFRWHTSSRGLNP
ncbi:hypothetical protein [Hymenobacter edaphi]|uniref:Uncharacterized protein n=1 Tax=Hymenobacter edaphi TaxID=2211146 RepID=A0A328BYQ5_9BACT|nr:hypothetical protein [Hymenobacter edaphi]RAK70268.1 hypothetical protein DLM85_05330 [Hymenobacter edaphi]